MDKRFRDATQEELADVGEVLASPQPCEPRTKPSSAPSHPPTPPPFHARRTLPPQVCSICREAMSKAKALPVRPRAPRAPTDSPFCEMAPAGLSLTKTPCCAA